MNEEIIYHYCTLNTFLEIIKNKTLRLSNISKSNDSLERSYILQNSKDTIYNFIKTRFPKYDISSEILYKSMIEQRIMSRVDFYNDQGIISHAICFSRDGDKLSQWRAYGDDGRGVAVGFDRAKINLYLNEKEHISVSDVHYNIDNSIILNQFIEDIVTDITQNFIYETAPIEAIIATICDELVTRLFLNEAMIYKNPAFEEEAEVRIHTKIPFNEFGSLTTTNDNGFIKNLIKEIHPLKVEYNFLAKSDKIVSYFDINFNITFNDIYIPNELIKGIVIGPKSAVTEMEVQHIMIVNKVGNCISNIKKSKASYR